ncbi:hypothetical protein [Niallia taxi]|uniref:hypothetical protein n=1 Tax=Niallia taxi TaxID=2499688 RepID=UPI0015F5F556|nr:hypothetical protein [Niallia taxi]
MNSSLVITRFETDWNEGRSSQLVRNLSYPGANISVRTKGYSDNAHVISATNIAVEELGSLFSYLTSMVAGKCYWMKVYFKGHVPPTETLQKAGFLQKDVYLIKSHPQMHVSAFPNGFGGAAKEWCLSFQDRKATVGADAITIIEDVYAEHGGQKNILDEYFGEVISL